MLNQIGISSSEGGVVFEKGRGLHDPKKVCPVSIQLVLIVVCLIVCVRFIVKEMWPVYYFKEDLFAVC